MTSVLDALVFDEPDGLDPHAASPAASRPAAATVRSPVWLSSLLVIFVFLSSSYPVSAGHLVPLYESDRFLRTTPL
jgi:hypothetical protein